MKRQVQYSYQVQRLNAARRCLMLPHDQGTAWSIAHAFNDCMHGFAEMDEGGLDDNARGWVAEIKELMNTDGIVDTSGEGTHLAKARTLSIEQQHDLSRAIDELANWFDRKYRESLQV